MRACPVCRLRYGNEEESCLVDGATLEELEDPRLGSELGGRYRLEEVLGRGGMATVYRGRQWRLGTDVAIKVLHARFADDQVARTRLEREAASTAQLAHPNIVEMFDVGQTNDLVPFVAMELLDGEPLDNYLRLHGGKLPVAEAIALGLQIARGLSRAHDFDVIHRDIKPENIFVCHAEDKEVVVKLVDFGIALVATAPRLTAGDIIGSPRYMAPERFKNRAQALARSDLYSLGVLLFEMVTGRLPFESESMAGFVLHHLETIPPKLSQLLPGVPPAFEQLVSDLLEKEPDLRPSDAHVVVGRLHEMASERARRVRHVSALTTGRMTMTPSPLQTWGHRARVYAQMAERVFGPTAPDPVASFLVRFQDAVERLRVLHKESDLTESALTDRLEALKPDRERVGHAVETLARDMSKARPDNAGLEHARKYQSILAQLIDLDLRSPDVPSEIGLRAIKEAQREYSAWLAARKATGVVDLEFQLSALRERLDRLEKEAAEERASATLRLEKNGKERQALETQLVALSQQLGSAFRAYPEVGDLFGQLRGG